MRSRGKIAGGIFSAVFEYPLVCVTPWCSSVSYARKLNPHEYNPGFNVDFGATITTNSVSVEPAETVYPLPTGLLIKPLGSERTVIVLLCVESATSNAI